MKKILPFLLSVFILSNCSKEEGSVSQDLVIQAMTNGQWIITRFTQNNNDITSNFSGYKFQFYSNKTVDAIKNGVTERTGKWDGSTATMTISADFTNSTNPVQLINGTWNITKNSLTYVEASQTNGTESKTLRLEKI